MVDFVIIKLLIYSKITHILLSLRKPSDHTFIDLHTVVDSFLWNNKPSKFRRETLEADISEGGLKLHKTICYIR